MKLVNLSRRELQDIADKLGEFIGSNEIDLTCRASVALYLSDVAKNVEQEIAYRNIEQAHIMWKDDIVQEGNEILRNLIA